MLSFETKVSIELNLNIPLLLLHDDARLIENMRDNAGPFLSDLASDSRFLRHQTATKIRAKMDRPIAM